MFMGESLKRYARLWVNHGESPPYHGVSWGTIGYPFWMLATEPLSLSLPLSLSIPMHMQDDALMLELIMLTGMLWVVPTNRHAVPKVSSNLEDQRSSARSYTLQCPVYLIWLRILWLFHRRTRFKMSLQTAATKVLTGLNGDTPDMLTWWLVIGVEGIRSPCCIMLQHQATQSIPSTHQLVTVKKIQWWVFQDFLVARTWNHQESAPHR